MQTLCLKMQGDVCNPELDFRKTEKWWRNSKKVKRWSLSSHNTGIQRTWKRFRNKDIQDHRRQEWGGSPRIGIIRESLSKEQFYPTVHGQVTRPQPPLHKIWRLFSGGSKPELRHRGSRNEKPKFVYLTVNNQQPGCAGEEVGGFISTESEPRQRKTWRSLHLRISQVEETLMPLSIYSPSHPFY